MMKRGSRVKDVSETRQPAPVGWWCECRNAFKGDLGDRGHREGKKEGGEKMKRREDG